MRILTVPNWSFGRDKDLLALYRDLLTGWDLEIHFLESDLDHNRTVSAFSGNAERVFERLERLAEAAFERIDLNRHVGVHPRIGALDVCPFIPLETTHYPLRLKIEAFAERIATRFQVPVFLYEKSERGIHPLDLPSLRKGGFGGLLMRELKPDFGPSRAHPLLGASVIGWRDFLIAMNINFYAGELAHVKEIAKKMRRFRAEGDPKWQGVRALGFPLPSRDLVQVSVNITDPDQTSPDSVVRFVLDEARRFNLKHSGNELIGVLRPEDEPNCTLFPYRAEQVVQPGPIVT